MISDETPILTVIVADTIVSEALRFAPFFDRTAAETHLHWRAENCFENNKSFRCKIKGSKGLDYMHSFMRHWLAGWLLKRGISREKIPSNWSNGQNP